MVSHDHLAVSTWTFCFFDTRLQGLGLFTNGRSALRAGRFSTPPTVRAGGRPISYLSKAKKMKKIETFYVD